MNYKSEVVKHGGVRAAAAANDVPYSTFRYRLNAEEADSGLDVVKTSTCYKVTGEDGAVTTQWITRKAANTQSVPDYKQAFIDYVNSPEFVTPVVPVISTDAYKYETDAITVYPFTDVHVGLRAWARSTGKNWDMKIFKEEYTTAAETLIARAEDTEEALIILNGDILHWDGKDPLTPTSGHPVDADTRTTYMMEVAVDYFKTVIDLALHKHKNITVNVVAGNHDLILSHMLAVMIRIQYQNEPRVKVNNCEEPMACYEFGRSAIFNTHGHVVRYKNAAQYAASRFREFSRCDYRVIFLGHLHTLKMEDIAGAEVIQLTTLTPDDSHGVGFNKSNKWLSSFTFSRFGGMLRWDRYNLELTK